MGFPTGILFLLSLYLCIVLVHCHETNLIDVCPRGKYSNTGIRTTTRIEDCLVGNKPVLILL